MPPTQGADQQAQTTPTVGTIPSTQGADMEADQPRTKGTVGGDQGANMEANQQPQINPTVGDNQAATPGAEQHQTLPTIGGLTCPSAINISVGDEIYPHIYVGRGPGPRDTKCPACRVDFEANDWTVTHSKCKTTFHGHCFGAWADTFYPKGPDCPRCRDILLWDDSDDSDSDSDDDEIIGADGEPFVANWYDWNNGYGCEGVDANGYDVNGVYHDPAAIEAHRAYCREILRQRALGVEVAILIESSPWDF